VPGEHNEVLGICYNESRTMPEGNTHSYNISLRAVNSHSGIVLWEVAVKSGSFLVPMQDAPDWVQPIVGQDGFIYTAVAFTGGIAVNGVSADGAGGWRQHVAGSFETQSASLPIEVDRKNSVVYVEAGPCFGGVHALSKSTSREAIIV